MAKLRVEVVCALADNQRIVLLEVADGTTAGEAARLSGLAGGATRLGIGGRAVAPGRLLRDGERIELLRPLVADPKDARRLRARKARRS